ncbi:MAG: redoxin domain-containing protein [Tepidiformaceae bacterium]
MDLEIGKPAPPFVLKNKKREEITLESAKGKHIVLAFYPLAFTGGCESEMTAFRTHTDAFTRANSQVYGVSVDSTASAGRFEEDLGLEFPLLSDFPAHQAGKDYGVYNEKYGTHSRTTVVIDKDGIVRDIYTEGREFESHPTHALDVLRSLGENPD